MKIDISESPNIKFLKPPETPSVRTATIFLTAENLSESVILYELHDKYGFVIRVVNVDDPTAHGGFHEALQLTVPPVPMLKEPPDVPF